MLKTLWRTLLLLLLGLLVLLAMAAYVRLTQDRPSLSDALRVSVPRDIVWPWESAQLWVDYSGAAGDPDATRTPLPATLLFLLDTSGSMTAFVEDEKRAILEMQRNMSRDGQTPRVGVMEFAENARVLSPFTSDMGQLAATLEAMPPSVGGGTSFIGGLSAALAMLNASGTTGVLVMLTDGAAGETPAVLADFFQNQWKPAGHELYLIGIGEQAADPASFYSLTDDPSRYILTSADSRIIPGLFREVSLRIGNGVGRNASLDLPLATPLWDWGEAPARQNLGAVRTWLVPTAHASRAPIGALFASPYQWTLPLAPRFGGILRTLYSPPQLRYDTLDGQPMKVDSSSHGVPKVLVITWLLLFMLMLPALLNVLAALLAWLFRDQRMIPALAPVQWRPPSRPLPNLPLRSAPEAQRIHWAPTLLIGLGRTGRGVLTQVQQNIADSLDRAATRPVLLALDVARDELLHGAGESFPGCLAPLGADRVFMLPFESCALDDAVARHRGRVLDDSDDPAAALDLTPYEAMGADALHLTKGTQRRPTLARLALLNDLSRGVHSDLLARLGQALDDWRRLSPQECNRQILLVAHVQGGVGAGWLTDLTILLRRLVEADEAAGQAVEINLLLVGDEQPRRGALVPLDAPILFAELDRLAAAGSRPFRHRLAGTVDTADPAAAVLDGWVRKRPQDAVLVLPGPPGTGVQPVAADAATLLIDRQRRHALTYQLQALEGAQGRLRAADGRECYTQLAIHNAVFPRSFFRAMLLARFTALLGSRQVLFPELDETGSVPVLNAGAVDGRALLQVEAAADPFGVAAALCEAAAGRCGRLQSLAADHDSLADGANALRLALLANANRGLQSRAFGLLGLAVAAGVLADQLRACAAKLGDGRVAADLVAVMAAVRRQALAWIECFFGSRALVELGHEAIADTPAGLLGANAARVEQVATALDEWARAPSRVLVAPLGRIDPTDRAPLDQRCDALLTRLVAGWLGTAQDPAAALAGRCFWELTAPGADGEPVGINLVLRGVQTYRYAPRRADLEGLERDLAAELGPVLDSGADFHILALLHAGLDDEGERALVPFVERLKGPLRGERSGLLATLPEAAPADGPDLRALRTALIRTVTTLTVSAAERVTVIDVPDRNRISVLQTLPLLRAPAWTLSGEPLHRPERRLQRETRAFALARGRESAALPAVLGIALEDRERLRQFARLHRNGQVRRHPLDGYWYVHGGEQPRRLGTRPDGPLVDAAADYVSHTLDIALAARAPGRSAPDADAGTDDFMDYLDWLATH